MKNVVLILFLFSCPDVCCQPVHAQDVDIRREISPVLQPRCCMCRGEDVQVVAGPLPIGQSFAAADSLKVPEDPSPDALKCLQGLCYGPAEFSVRCEPSTAGAGDCLLRFPSAKPTGLPQNDEVVVEWYAVTSKTGEAVCAPAVIVVHESGRGMTVGRMMARGFRDRGLHALMVQLPFYGLRRPPGERAEDHGFAVVMGQGIADVRRALDAVRALPRLQATMSVCKEPVWEVSWRPQPRDSIPRFRMYSCCWPEEIFLSWCGPVSEKQQNCGRCSSDRVSAAMR
ncbi:MAG: hypothetical protein R3C49_14915 [Planctomycetaceae bacterium]